VSNQALYLDSHATTPVDPRVLEAMLPYFSDFYGNAASKNHGYGNDAHAAVEKSREILARAINAREPEVIFTSGATESINLAIKGLAETAPPDKRHLVTVATEHKAVLDCHEYLEGQGFTVTYLPVDSHGILNLNQLQDAIVPETLLVSVMHANNEIGVIQDIAAIGEICEASGVYFFSDATQSLGKVPIDVAQNNIHMLAASAHKVYGPKGVGMLYLRRSNPRVKPSPVIHGGGHERGFRSGTLNVPGIVGFGKAVEIARKEMKKENQHLATLRDGLEAGLLSGISGAKVNGHPEKRLAHNLNIVLPGVDAEALMIALKEDVACSSGSACTTAAVLPSHVLTALGLEESDIHSSLRFGLCRGQTAEDIERVIPSIAEKHGRLASFA
jgi:cysteine desulfurase